MTRPARETPDSHAQNKQNQRQCHKDKINTHRVQNNEEQRKQNHHRKKDNIQRKNQITKKSKVPLIPAQKNKHHYDIEKITRKFLAST
jgi:hypothetical protein